MQKGNSIRSGSGKIGGASVEIKQATMLRLIGAATGLTVVNCADVSLEEKARFTGGQWELHGLGKGSNFAVDTSTGETLTVLSRTMLVYFLAVAASRLTEEARATLTEKVIGKLLSIGEAGTSASKWEGGFSSASVGDKGFAVLTSLRTKAVNQAREAQAKALELATAQESAKVGPVVPINSQKGNRSK